MHALAALLCSALKPVRTFTTPGFSFVHVGNAFESEDGTTLNVDLGVFDSANILNDLKMMSLRQGPDEGRDVTGCPYMRLSLPLSEADPDVVDAAESSNLPVSGMPHTAAAARAALQVLAKSSHTLRGDEPAKGLLGFLSCSASATLGSFPTASSQYCLC